MYIDDILLCAMFVRFYFLVIGITMLLPSNSDLVGKRLASDFKFKPNFIFLVKANLMRYKARTTLLIFGISVIFFAAIIRIFERPFYTEIGELDF